MSHADGVPRAEMISAIGRLRAAGSPPDVDDEDLALFIDGGIAAVPPVARAGLLRAIGQSPELATVVVELSRTREGERVSPVVSTLGSPRTGWRIAWAACALLAVSLTAWLAVGGGSSAPAEVGLLDGSIPVPAVRGQSFVDWFAGTPLRVLVAGLWVVLCILTLPALPPVRRPSGQDPREGR